MIIQTLEIVIHTDEGNVNYYSAYKRLGNIRSFTEVSLDIIAWHGNFHWIYKHWTSWTSEILSGKTDVSKYPGHVEGLTAVHSWHLSGIGDTFTTLSRLQDTNTASTLCLTGDMNRRI